MSASNALSANVMLATGMQSQPGVYALLLGSGVSRASGIPTGWEIVKDLVRRVAVASDPSDEGSQSLAASDPEGWWQEHGEGELGYSSILRALASRPAARQGLLAKYFVASEEDLEAGLKAPTAAHLAIARLVKSGHVKVIVTTNFDRLMEQALDAIGAPYQVISRPAAIKAATPLAHAAATILKLHGDWMDLDSRNTIDELDTYPRQWRILLERIFNEYGLVVSGWSAEWDKALVRILEATPRRYPLYWDSRSSTGAAARNLLSQYDGHVIESAGADELFNSLEASIQGLETLSEPPLTTALAVARLKRAMPDPLRRIELVDLISDGIEQVTDSLFDAAPKTARDATTMDAYLDTMLARTEPLLALLVNGARYDDGSHSSLWVEALERLMARPQEHRTGMVQTVDELRQYPALLALRAMSIEAVNQRRDEMLIDLLSIPRYTDSQHPYRSPYAADVLHTQMVIDWDFANSLPRWGGQKWRYPSSHLLNTVLREFFGARGVDASRYELLCHDVEFRTGLVQHLLPREKPAGQEQEPFHHGANWGEFLLRRSGWEGLTPQGRFREDFSRGNAEVWGRLFGPSSLDEVLRDYDQAFDGASRW